MIYTAIHGGLGNQMFQYAIARSLSFYYKVPFKLDLVKMENYNLREFSLDLLNVSANVANRSEVKKYHNSKYKDYLLRQLYRKNIKLTNKIFEKNEFQYNEIIFENSDVYLDGYWQSYKYFENIRDILLEEFSLKSDFNLNNQSVLKNIKASNSISIHIRRGDYLLNNTNRNLYCVYGIKYYFDAIAFLSKKIDNAHFFIFSDDLDWARKEIIIPNATFVDANCKENFENDMFLMSKCKHNIIANSSFSWWGAYLGSGTGKVIVPPQWFGPKGPQDIQDLIPEKWMKI